MITIVSGLPRSGTSLMMQILRAGGLQVLTDNVRCADDNNPKGYYEYEKVKSLMKDNSWLDEAEGKAIKVIAQLIPFLPDDFEYKVIFMEREIDEIIHSQNKMIDKLGGKKAAVGADILKKTFTVQADKVKNFLNQKKNFKTLFTSYNLLIEKGREELNKINNGLNLELQLENALTQIDKNLYRSKGNLLS
ncbi:MAG: sulfotransferase family protein [Ignavibacteria bacterium]|jgi:hypothetical protein